VGVQGLDGLLANVLREIVVDFICDRVINLATYSSNFFTFLACEDDVTVLRLRVEHDASDWIVFGFDSNHKFFTVLFVGRENVKEVSQGLSLGVGIGLDCPRVRVKIQIICLKFLQEPVGEGLKEGVLFRIFNSPVKRS